MHCSVCDCWVVMTDGGLSSSKIKELACYSVLVPVWHRYKFVRLVVCAVRSPVSVVVKV